MGGIKKSSDKVNINNEDLEFEHLPAFARWILQERLDEFSRLMLQYSKSENIPILKLFSQYSDEQLLALGKVSHAELLDHLSRNQARNHIDVSIGEWTANRLETIKRDEIAAEDIVLISLVRRQVFRHLLETYANDIPQYRKIMEELDRFTVASDLAAFNAYVIIHQENIEMMNQQLNTQRTELLALLEKLKQSEDLHNQAQALTHIGNWSWDILRNEISWSDEMYRIYGLEPQSEQITFDRFMSLVHPDDRQTRIQEIKNALETGKADDYILNIVTPAEEQKILKGIGELVFDLSGKPVRFNGTCQDITTEYRLNQTMHEQEEYLALLINNAPDAVIVIDENSIIRLWNPKTEAIFGWKADEVLGLNITETIIPFHYREAHKNGMRHYLASGQGNVINRTTEITAVNKANQELYISLTISEIIQKGRRSFIAFIRNVTVERQTRIELRDKTMLLEQKNRELEHTNEELESFNYAASHDLQEPLRKIQVFASRLIENDLPLPSNLQGYVQKIISSSARMQRLINDLLLFTQTASSEESFELVDLSHLVNEAKSMLTHMIDESGAQISYDKLPVIQAVSFQLLQVFINLIGNAIKYQKPGISPEITIRSSIVKSEELGHKSGNLQGNYLKISIADNGIGFDPQFADRLFDLFTRLHNKEKYPGTGIGLAICKKIIQNHRGFIVAESDGITGSTFHIYLPEEKGE